MYLAGDNGDTRSIYGILEEKQATCHTLKETEIDDKMDLWEIYCEDGKRIEVAQNRIQMWILALAGLHLRALVTDCTPNVKPQLTSWLRCAKCSCNTNKNIHINKPLQFA